MADDGMSSKERRFAKNKVAVRMKGYEDEHNPKLDPTLPYACRLDGHAFSGFTKGLEKPYDARLSAVMAQVMLDSLDHFNAITGYTHSDEITLIFGPAKVENGSTLAYNGKVVKTCSLMAGYVSARFNARMLEEDWTDLSAATQEKIAGCKAYFDCRAFSLPDADEVLANLRWRSNFDCLRNSVSMLARAYYSARALHGVSTSDVIAMLEDEKGVAWEDQPPFFRFGCLAKKEKYSFDAIDRKTGEPVVAIRSRVVIRSFQLVEHTPELVGLMLSKHWGEFDGERESVWSVDQIRQAVHARPVE